MEGNNKKALFFLGALAAFAVGFFCCANIVRAANSCNDHIIVSQIYGGGGNTGATYKNDFIELYNPTAEDITINDWSVQYTAATGNFPTTSSKTTLLQGEIKAKSYYLIQEHSSANIGQSLENSDATGEINFAADKGRAALVHNTTLIGSEDDTLVEDFVSYTGGSNTKSVFRNLDSCPNTFYADTPNPRNSSITEGNGSDDTDDGDENNDDQPGNDTDDIQNPPEECATVSADIRLNEIFPYPESGDEFVEIINVGENCADVSGWKIMDEANHKIIFPEESIIDPEGFLILEGNLYFNNDSDTVYLLDAAGNTKNDALDHQFYEDAQKNFSYSFNGENWQWTSAPTPDDENVIISSREPADDENFSSADKVYLNEILPNPKNGSDSEYIEIKNDGGEDVDLYGWTIRDASKTGKYIFKEHTTIKPGKYLAIYRPQFKIALNNGAESIYLYNPAGALVSSASYDKAPQGVSYNFDGQNWKWSKYLTPKKENKFDSAPAVKIKKVKNAYKNLFTEFSASAKDKETKKLKYTWDFGDGRKSYLAKTSHKYLATGNYRVTLTVRDDSQAVEKSFSVKVKKYPRPDLEFLKLLPNPAGADEKGEIVDIRNNSKKKIDLKGWKIATGSASSKIYNHPVSEELILNPGETKTITREISKFSLNNKAGIVQLIFPDGKIADDVEYEKEKITDNEAYIKLNDEWIWLTPNAPKDGAETAADETDDTTDEEETGEEGEVLGTIDENAPAARYKPGFSPEDAYVFLSQISFAKPAAENPNYCPVSNSSFSIAYLLASTI